MDDETPDDKGPTIWIVVKHWGDGYELCSWTPVAWRWDEKSASALAEKLNKEKNSSFTRYEAEEVPYGGA